MGETLLWYGDKLPAADRDAWTARFAEVAEYLCQNIEKLGGNINYPITCAYTMALAALPFGRGTFAAKASSWQTSPWHTSHRMACCTARATA